MIAREIKLQRKARQFRGEADDARISTQIQDLTDAGLLDYGRDPRAKMHLDSTKLSLHKERVEAWRRGEWVAPITIDMALTQKCSYSCTFCYAGLQQNPEAPVEWAVYERFLDDCAEMGVKAISLVSDGESTENPDFVPFVVRAKSLGIDVACGTNGLKLRDLETLVRSLTYLRINFNAADPARYSQIMGASERSYQQVCATIRELVRLKRETGSECTIGLQQVLLPEYADEVLPLALLGKTLGVDYLVIKHCSSDEQNRLGVPYPWYRSELAETLYKAAEALSTDDYSVQCKLRKLRTGNQREYSRCYGPPLFLQLSGSGVVAPCGSFFHERYKRFHIGDLKTQRFRDILHSPEYLEVMAHLRSDAFDPRKQCAALCLQDSANLALFNWLEHGTSLPEAINNEHRNFL